MPNPLKLAVIALPLLLVGCMSAEELRARDEQTCRDYGFKKRNDAFAQCLQRIDLDRRAQSRANQAELARMQRELWYDRYYYRGRPYYRPPYARPPRPSRPQT